MRFVITGGGTAGHVNPALALAQELQNSGHEVFYAGTPQGFESKLIPQEGIDYTGFEASGFNRKKPLSLITSSAKIGMSALRASKWLKSLKPDAVIGFGGYVSIPVGLAASWRKIPLAIHEQNSRAGLANRLLAQRAQLIALSYSAAQTEFSVAKGRIRITGNPVRSALFTANRTEARESFGLAQDAVVLLVFGGSLGALHLNEAIVANAEWLLAQPGLAILHITGSRDFAMVQEAQTVLLETQGELPEVQPARPEAEITTPEVHSRWRLIEYCDRMGDAYAAADAVLSRAGATTLAEIAALGKPALLVPYPHAAADEQTTNAKSLVDAGAADMIADNQLDTPLFREKLERLVSDAAWREAMLASARSLGNAQARQELAALVIELASDGR